MKAPEGKISPTLISLIHCIIFNRGMPLHCELYFQVTRNVCDIRRLSFTPQKIKYRSSISHQIHILPPDSVFLCNTERSKWILDKWTQHKSGTHKKRFLYSHKYMEGHRSPIIITSKSDIHSLDDFLQFPQRCLLALFLSFPSICYEFAVNVACVI